MTSFPQYSSFCISAPILPPPPAPPPISTPPLSAACVTAGSCRISFHFFSLQLLHRPDTRRRRRGNKKKNPNKNTRPHLTNQRRRLSRLSPSASPPPPPQWDDPKSTSHLSSLTPPALTFKSGDAARLLAAALERLPVATHSSSHPLFFPSCPSVIVPPSSPRSLLPRIHPPPLFSSTTSPPAPDAFSLF